MLEFSGFQGKSTFINRYLDREESPKTTLALEYSYGRRTSPGQGIQKQICHVWELGTVVNSEQLLCIPFRSNGLENSSVIIMIDLSKPEKLWNDISSILVELKNVLRNCKPPDNATHLQNFSKEHITENLFPLPVYIIGGKYDMFQDKDPEIKKQVCKCLRAIAHQIGASVFFYTTQNSSMGRTVRDILNHCGFGSPANPIRNLQTDYNAPLSVPFGQDTWNSIGFSAENLEAIGAIFCRAIPQEDSSIAPLPSDPLKDTDFREPIIDELRAQKDEELHTLLKHTDIIGRFEKIN